MSKTCSNVMLSNHQKVLSDCHSKEKQWLSLILCRLSKAELCNPKGLLSPINDTLDTLCGSQWFSTLDLLCSYWQVEVADKDREKTAFVTQDGLFEFTVVPFELCNAPATFQRLVLAGGKMFQVLGILSNSVIGKSCEEHL